MATTTIKWHYARTDLAEQVLDRFDIGATTALTLFAPRRMGKTEFLLEDLLPMAAEQQDYLTVYVNFWDRMADPVDSMILGLQKASRQFRFTTKAKQVLSRLRGGGIDTPVGGLRLELAEADRRQKLEAVQEMFDALMNDGRRVLLALDEVQHLATNSAFEPLVFALRGMIDTNRQQVRVIYTGSSRSGLQKLFKRRNAPLFSSAQQIELPEFGRGYLEHMATAFNMATGRTLDINACQAAFKMIKKVPFDYRQVLDQLILGGGTDIRAATSAYIQENSQDETYSDTWTEMKPVDQAVVRWVLSRNPQGIYSQDARAFIAERLGLDKINIHPIQNAVNRLMRNTVIAPVGQGRYEVEDPYFADWVTRTLPNQSR
ncbi:hypothetical protein HG264_11515 [Pseudomonas sp. gcc21]|uniref:hypothetical protein n=1 Tax=Pseudomonas sp. gcc21 TaxID=2726989 RepID=UPI001451D784|nr:hypothetical protein [Pseudomonas sp. gcc21]QJD59489.1 hypothetical protein HG264_11515 [Pseudomonas sp. gcc21]